MTIDELMSHSFNIAHEKGWHDPLNVMEKLCLIHSEVSEAVEDYRNDAIVTYIEEKNHLALSLLIYLFGWLILLNVCILILQKK